MPRPELPPTLSLNRPQRRLLAGRWAALSETARSDAVVIAYGLGQEAAGAHAPGDTDRDRDWATDYVERHLAALVAVGLLDAVSLQRWRRALRQGGAHEDPRVQAYALGYRHAAARRCGSGERGVRSSGRCLTP